MACPTRNQATSPPRQAPLRHPSHLSQIAQWKQKINKEIKKEIKKIKKKNTKKKGGDREGTPTNTKLPIQLATPRQQSSKHMGPQRMALTRNTSGQSQPQGSRNLKTAANATERLKR